MMGTHRGLRCDSTSSRWDWSPTLNPSRRIRLARTQTQERLFLDWVAVDGLVPRSGDQKLEIETGNFVVVEVHTGTT